VEEINEGRKALRRAGSGERFLLERKEGGNKMLELLTDSEIISELEELGGLRSNK
jgi:hypothetical protein